MARPYFVEPEDVVAFVRATCKDVLTFVGYSAAGYEDPVAMRALVRAALRRFDPATTLVNGGATEVGIGAAYALAKTFGFATMGIVSALAVEGNETFARDVDTVFVIRDTTWGGRLAGSAELAPTSRAMVDASTTLIGIGGGDVARDELLAARAAGKKVDFFPADMNHAVALAKARDKKQTPPTDFRGSAHHALLGA